jgi:hypothetical protein
VKIIELFSNKNEGKSLFHSEQASYITISLRKLNSAEIMNVELEYKENNNQPTSSFSKISANSSALENLIATLPLLMS